MTVITSSSPSTGSTTVEEDGEADGAEDQQADGDGGEEDLDAKGEPAAHLVQVQPLSEDRPELASAFSKLAEAHGKKKKKVVVVVIMISSGQILEVLEVNAILVTVVLVVVVVIS